MVAKCIQHYIHSSIKLHALFQLTFGETTLIISLRKRNFPISWWNLWPQFFTDASNVWKRKSSVNIEIRNIHVCIKLLHANFFQREQKHIFTLYIPPHWHDTGSLTPPWSKTTTYLFYVVNIMGADVLAIGSRRLSGPCKTVQFRRSDGSTYQEPVNRWIYRTATFSMW